MFSTIMEELHKAGGKRLREEADDLAERIGKFSRDDIQLAVRQITACQTVITQQYGSVDKMSERSRSVFRGFAKSEAKKIMRDNPSAADALGLFYVLLKGMDRKSDDHDYCVAKASECFKEIIGRYRFYRDFDLTDEEMQEIGKAVELVGTVYD